MSCNNCKYKVCDRKGVDYCAAGVDLFPNGEGCETFKERAANKSLEELREKQKRFNKKAEVTENDKAYYKKLREKDKLETDYSIDGLLASLNTQRVKQKFIPYPIKLADGKALFRNIYEAEVLKRKQKVSYSDSAKKLIPGLIAYFLGQNSDFDNNKGIYLYGDVGRGKTLLMDCFSTFTKIIENKLSLALVDFTPRSFDVSNCVNIVKQIDIDKDLSSVKKYYSGNHCFDDLANEDNLKQWGNNMNVMDDIFTIRYSRIRNSGSITHATSNMMFKEERILDRYGARIESRFNEMFTPIFWDGVDYRKE